MFNNIKYKVCEEVINPVIKIEDRHDDMSSSLTLLDERVVDGGDITHPIPSPYIEEIKAVLKFYKPLTVLGKIVYFYHLIKTLIVNIKSLYNEQ